MACLAAPATAALITKIIGKKIPAKYHVEWLYQMLVGGTIMLIVDHVIGGEIVPYAPFFTGGLNKIFQEIWRVGVPMVVVTILVWVGAVVVVNLKNKTVLQSN